MSTRGLTFLDSARPTCSIHWPGFLPFEVLGDYRKYNDHPNQQFYLQVGKLRARALVSPLAAPALCRAAPGPSLSSFNGLFTSPLLRILILTPRTTFGTRCGARAWGWLGWASGESSDMRGQSRGGAAHGDGWALGQLHRPRAARCQANTRLQNKGVGLRPSRVLSSSFKT